MSRFIVPASLIVLVVAWFVALRPVVLGGPASYILVGGESMEPTVQAGSLVVAFRADVYQVGDVVVYRVPDGDIAAGRQVIHRIVGGTSANGYILQGDNTTSVDVWQPTGRDVLGKAAVVVPAIADAIVFVRSPVVIASLTSAMAAYAVLWICFVSRPVKTAS